MKKYIGLYKYLKPFKKNVTLYLVSIVLSIIFSVVSIAMLFPFLQIIFTSDSLVTQQPKMEFTATAILGALQYYLSQVIIEHGKIYALTMICVYLVLSIFFKNLFLYLSAYFLSPIRNGIMVQLRNDLFSKILTLPIGYFNDQRKGDLMSRMTNDTWELEITASSLLDGMIKDPLSVIFYLVTLVFLSPQLSLILLFLLPIAGVLIGRVSKSLKKQSNIAAIKSSEGLTILEEVLSGMRVIKAFTSEFFVQKKFTDVNAELFDAKNKINYRRELASPLSEMLGVMVLCVILWFGGRLIINNGGMGLNGAGFIMYIGIFSQIISPAKSISTTFYNLKKGEAALGRINEVLDAPNIISDIEGCSQLASFNSSIEFKNVSFKYDDKIVLDKINIVIPKGKTVALVGSSGSGKSTLADLIPRFHDVSEGELLIDGINIKEYSLQSIRSQVSIVTQEPILFNDTIRSNIALGKPGATTQEIEHALAVANAFDFMQGKENGLDSNIGDRGSRLSGGERQRLTIARAILKNAPILILDEATSALDTESERLVQDAINKMLKNRTSIVIAHRLSTIRHADEIIVMSHGKIAERGNHESLLAQDGIYRRLVEMQEVR